MNNGKNVVVMSKMRHDSRQREVEWFERFFTANGFIPLHFSGDVSFEGMGDVIPHPGKRLLYGGYGFRTKQDAYQELCIMLETPLIALELVNPGFYHLDTCFLPLSKDSVMICSTAFTPTGLELINRLFAKVYEIEEAEASTFFSLNAHAFDLQRHKIAIIQKGSNVAKDILEKEGFELIEIETGEFMKSGGSVFCMKMMY